jgi:hypothetical protein|tara:strand:+ start:744 stop:1985 length:1242 start_codon:yes stop_codon:yes gene_type:complete
MSDGYGTPIRLHFDGGVGHKIGLGDKPFPPMELQALSIALSVERKVGGMPIPLFGGSRIGIDLNMVNSTIVIEGIFTDDDVNRRSSPATAATSVIDFAVNQAETSSIGKFVQVANSIFFSNLEKLELKEKQSADSSVTVVKTIHFVPDNSKDFSNPGVSNVVTDTNSPSGTKVYTHSSSTTPAHIAASVVTALGASHLNSTITGSVSTSEFAPAAGSSKLTLTQGVNGAMLVNDSVKWFVDADNYAPYHRPFSGGSSATDLNNKSAGDKVQDLYGILHNTDRGTAALVAGLAVGVATGGVGLAVGAVAGGVLGFDGLFNGDYPIGLQIPYNSMITADDGKKYSVRNFMIQTGLFVDTNEKIASGNTKSANVDFSTTDETTGIQGTIQKFDVGYNAGEQHYTFQMVFAPIDMII